ncbi:gluconate 2-dehydrogenase subunit 3 family protein [Halobacterium bonnevillei]|uniref:Gluconate 2-dehydrogenase subunit 3 family protein n=1 Tax=Halobacterium bonnevillei TaxID=2692200 RepID=A0A6B0SGU7_9EURY|nr:gluconate 2-dehydrogenase subunit 3 family protein [Halobacterium bonnevillei]MXR20227.1 gluconate 2-dehydrogenase subunit 3 family protein [Halobacterium bonnevillei]
MRLTRRDALEALAAGTVAGLGSVTVSELATRLDDQEAEQQLNRIDIETAEAVADVVYPSEVTVSPEFIETYYSSMPAELRAEAVRAIRDLNTASKRQFSTAFANVESRKTRDDMLRALGVNRAQSNPDGTIPERVRYFLVNGLLYALFTTPKGAELFGIDNPKGYAGGFATFQTETE